MVNCVVNDPTSSQRHIAEQTGLSKTSVQRLLKKEKFHPYKPHYFQKLYDADADRRSEFCTRIIDMSNNDPALVRKFVFSDECNFELIGRVNKHNIHYWGRHNPNIVHETPVKTASLTVWAAINFNGLMSYKIMRETMNGERYCQILNENVVPILTAQGHATWFFQQDGAPPHYSVEARRILDERLDGRWIGRRGPIEWPARSPDLTPVDYWFWSYLRGRVFNPPDIQYPNLDALQRKIEEEITLIPLDMYRRSAKDFLKRVRQCLDVQVNILNFKVIVRWSLIMQCLTITVIL